MHSPGHSAQQDILAGDKHSCPGHPKTASATADPLLRTLLGAPVPPSVPGTHRRCSRRRCSQQGSGTSLWQRHTAPHSCTRTAARSYGRTTQGSTLRETKQQWCQCRNRQERGPNTPPAWVFSSHVIREESDSSAGSGFDRAGAVDGCRSALQHRAAPKHSGVTQPQQRAMGRRGPTCPKHLRQHERLQATLRSLCLPRRLMLECRDERASCSEALAVPQGSKTTPGSASERGQSNTARQVWPAQNLSADAVAGKYPTVQKENGKKAPWVQVRALPAVPQLLLANQSWRDTAEGRAARLPAGPGSGKAARNHLPGQPQPPATRAGQG